MAFFNMPPGCLGPSDIDHYEALGIYDHQDQDSRCPSCNAGSEEACERWCGFLSDNGNWMIDEKEDF
jgi:hypothetical protein